MFSDRRDQCECTDGTRTQPTTPTTRRVGQKKPSVEAKGPDRTQWGKRTQGQTGPSVVRGQRAKQESVWSENTGPDRTQCGQRPKGPTEPSVVRFQRAKQESVWSEAKGTDRTQCGQRPKGPTEPSVVRFQSARQDPVWSENTGPDRTQRGRASTSAKTLKVRGCRSDSPRGESKGKRCTIFVIFLGTRSCFACFWTSFCFPGSWLACQTEGVGLPS